MNIFLSFECKGNFLSVLCRSMPVLDTGMFLTWFGLCFGHEEGIL